MRVLDLVVVAGQRGRVQTVFLHQVVHQQPRARAFLAVHEAQQRAATRAQQVGQRAHGLCVLAAQHQPLLTARAADQLVQPGLEQRLHRLREQRRGAPQHRHVEAGHQALPGVQRAQAVDAALVADVQVQRRAGRGVLLQLRQRQVVAGADAHQLLLGVAGLGQQAAEVGAQGLDLRLDARTGAAFGPQQPLGKRRQAAGLAAHPGQQRLAQRLLPLLEQAPGMPVRTLQRERRVLDRPPLAHGAEQREQRVLDVGPALGARTQRVVQVHAQLTRRGGGGAGFGGRRRAAGHGRQQETSVLNGAALCGGHRALRDARPCLSEDPYAIRFHLRGGRDFRPALSRPAAAARRRT